MHSHSIVVIAVYNCTIQKNKCLRARDTPLRPKDERRSKSGSRPREPRAPLHKTTWVTQKKISYKQSNNHKKLYKGHSGAKKAPKASSPWASSLVKARLVKDSEWGDPRAMESSRGPAPFKKDNLPRQKG